MQCLVLVTMYSHFYKFQVLKVAGSMLANSKEAFIWDSLTQFWFCLYVYIFCFTRSILYQYRLFWVPLHSAFSLQEEEVFLLLRHNRVQHFFHSSSGIPYFLRAFVCKAPFLLPGVGVLVSGCFPCGMWLLVSRLSLYCYSQVPLGMFRIIIHLLFLPMATGETIFFPESITNPFCLFVCLML